MLCLFSILPQYLCMHHFIWLPHVFVSFPRSTIYFLFSLTQHKLVWTRHAGMVKGGVCILLYALCYISIFTCVIWSEIIVWILSLERKSYNYFVLFSNYKKSHFNSLTSSYVFIVRVIAALYCSNLAESCAVFHFAGFKPISQKKVWIQDLKICSCMINVHMVLVILHMSVHSEFCLFKVVGWSQCILQGQKNH